MDPFRDELAAAHAKIAELEREIIGLKSQTMRSAVTQDRQVETRQRVVILALVAGMTTAFVLIGGLLFVARGRTRGSGPAVTTSSASVSPKCSCPHVDQSGF